MTDDKRLFAPAAERNASPIWDVLRTVLPATGTVLEIASGTGQHTACFAERAPRLTWQPSDPTPESRASIEDYRVTARLANMLPPLALDALADSWPQLTASLVLCINMIHIAPYEAWEGLTRHAARVLKPGQALVIYGPFFREGVETAESNAAFDESLRRRNPRWGVRRLEDVTKTAEAAGFYRSRVEDMPANNLTVIFFRH